MFGKVQKSLYYFLLFCPFVMPFICLLLDVRSIWIVLITANIVIAVILGMAWWLRLCRKLIPTIPFHAQDIAPADDKFFSVFLSYAVPILAVQSDISFTSAVVIAGICAVLMLLSSTVHLSPAFLILKYHVYSISSDGGLSGYLFITKRDIRAPKQIQKVKQVFDFFLLDAED